MSDSLDLAKLRGEYPAWMIRPTAQGASFMATRADRYDLSSQELGAGLAMTLIEDDVEGLAEALAGQARIESAR
ncbi:hypothetical protein EDD29_9087 [Actinocorallia herbida]|uniref:Uncharacterized protein n=1 Tax=Actinocorallia herbida TaxID=58109 RepID=A0A3N1DCU4_9ACTN|nr:hypothetical protein [Actinocorallia herbida]ROO91333.1 hypothetical protein EDD29_9087 [Actinocorallia herbida]